MKKFLKATDLQLVNGGYLSNKEESPVTNEAFVKAQKHAEYIITFAKLAKGKTFVAKKADSLSDLKAEVSKALAAKKTAYVAVPTKPGMKTTDTLAKEAMAFLDFGKDVNKAKKINEFLSQFDVLKEFEDFGLFFEDGIVKLNKIYTVKDVVTAVEATIDLLED
jgi:hypothetical protein